jgi:hypothetical protein
MVQGMNAEQSKSLKIGERVSWRGESTDLGTVIEKNWNAVKIKWDAGKTSEFHHNETGDLILSKAK